MTEEELHELRQMARETSRLIPMMSKPQLRELLAAHDRLRAIGNVFVRHGDKLDYEDQYRRWLAESPPDHSPPQYELLALYDAAHAACPGRTTEQIIAGWQVPVAS